MSSLQDCRICLLPILADTLKEISHYSFDNRSYHSIYEYCIGIPLNMDAAICDTCEKNLLNSYEFKKQCLATVELLSHQQFKNESVEIDDIIEFTDIDTLNYEDEDTNNKNDNSSTEEDPTYSEKTSDENVDCSVTDDSNKSTPKNVNRTSRTQRNEKAKMREYKSHTSLCPFCGKVIKTTYLAKHLISHENIPHEKRPFECDICGARFKIKDTLQCHKRTHTREKRYECPFCNEKFQYWSTKKLHISSYHTGESKFQCSICDAKFCISSIYKRHIKIHTGENLRKFSCALCDKQFESNYKLKLHLTSHSDERNVKCEFCDKTYKTIKSLNVHLRNHTGEKNYVCPVCSKAFTQNLLLKSHVLKNHPDFKLPPAGTIISKKHLEKLATKVL